MAAEIRDCVNHARRSTERYQKTSFKMRRNNKESIFLLLTNIIKEYYNAVFSIDNDNLNEKEMGMTQKTLSLILCISLEKLVLRIQRLLTVDTTAYFKADAIQQLHIIRVYFMFR